jgi:hypothetical protein
MSTRPLLRTSRSDVSARKTYDLIDEPVGPEYDALLDSALTQCATVVLTVPGGMQHPVLEELADHLQEQPAGTGRRVHRYRFNRDSVQPLKRAARALYAWHGPELPQDLCLLRADGSPWLVSIASERLGYLELTPFEKLLLGRAAPGLAAVLAHQVARDAILAYFERRYESHVEALTADILQYATGVLNEGREGLVEAMAAWLDSGEDARVTAALEVTRTLVLTELRRDVAALARSAEDPRLVPDAFRDNVVLRERWRSRRRRHVERALDAIPAETRASGAG